MSKPQEDFKTKYTDLRERLKAIQKEIADVLLFVDYAKAGHVNGVTGDEATLWAAGRLTKIAGEILNL